VFVVCLLGLGAAVANLAGVFSSDDSADGAPAKPGITPITRPTPAAAAIPAPAPPPVQAVTITPSAASVLADLPSITDTSALPSLQAAVVPTASSAALELPLLPPPSSNPEPAAPKPTLPVLARPADPARVSMQDQAAMPPGTEIVVDDADPGALLLKPEGAWTNSIETRRSYANSSMVARVDGPTKVATFIADVPVSGRYDVLLYWTRSSEPFRSRAVVVYVHGSDGPVRVVIDQANSGDEFISIGMHRLAAGKQVPVVSITSEQVPPLPETHISVDALKLVKLHD
jgi:hypothetical protein